MAAHEVRWLELDLDATKVALATSEGETATAQVRIAGKDFPHLVVLMDVHGLCFSCRLVVGIGGAVGGFSP